MMAVDQSHPKSSGQSSTRFSLVPFVGLGVGWFFVAQANRLYASGAMPAQSYIAMLAWIAALGAWGLLMMWLSLSGRGRSPGFLKLLPGLWVPPFMVLATAAGIAIFPSLRSALSVLASGVPEHQFILLQTLRIAAIGSVIKTSLGRLPPAFGFGSGIPDLLFGLSAAAIFWTGAYADLAPNLLIAWNIFGALVFIGASIILQLCLPGPLQIFRREPDGRELLDFPMFLAPALFGPVLLMGNCLHAAKYVLQSL
jgi:hypothetical protein